MFVRESAELIASLSTDVKVDNEKCKQIAQSIRQKMVERNYGTSTWSTHCLNPDSSTPGVVDWIFTVDTLNFSFWSDDSASPFEVYYKGVNYTGYWSLVASINRALDENISITTPAFWNSSEFTTDLFSHVFRSTNKTEVPLFKERFNALKEAGKALSHVQSFEDIIKQCNHSALQLITWVTKNIPSYNDQFVYRGKHDVQFFKRAQILVADLWACFGGKGLGRFDDIDKITMFADYRVPQILHVLGAIQYSPSLTTKIQNETYIPSGSDEEIEIRGCSIHSVDLIVKEIKKIEHEQGSSNNINAILVDFYLWDTAKEQESDNTKKIKCHRTRSVFY